MRKTREPIESQINLMRFGDKRLDKRFRKSYLKLEKSGFKKSFPEAFNQQNDLHRFYELMNNTQLTSDRFNDGYLNGLLDYFNANKKQYKDVDYVFNYQDTTYGKYHNWQVELGYIDSTYENGLLIHTGILTGPNHIPIGISHQEYIIRDRGEIGKKKDRKQKNFEEKESYKWVKGLRWAKKFSTETGRQVVQVLDAEGDIAEYCNLATQMGQHYIIRSKQNRKIEGSKKLLKEFIAGEETQYETIRKLRDRQGKQEDVLCKIGCKKLQINKFDEPVWVIYLRASPSKLNLEHVEWILLSNLPVRDDEALVLRVIDTYTKRWKTAEDFHKVLKSGCGIEERQFKNANALKNTISLMSLAAIRILRMRHMAEEYPNAKVDEVLDEQEIEIAMVLGKKYLRPVDLKHCKPGTTIWWTLLLGRIGGHQGYSNKGMPGWITLSRGWQQFQEIYKGFILAKQLYDFPN